MAWRSPIIWPGVVPVNAFDDLGAPFPSPIFKDIAAPVGQGSDIHFPTDLNPAINRAFRMRGWQTARVAGAVQVPSNVLPEGPGGTLSASIPFDFALERDGSVPEEKDFSHFTRLSTTGKPIYAGRSLENGGNAVMDGDPGQGLSWLHPFNDATMVLIGTVSGGSILSFNADTDPFADSPFAANYNWNFYAQLKANMGIVRYRTGELFDGAYTHPIIYAVRLQVKCEAEDGPDIRPLFSFDSWSPVNGESTVSTVQGEGWSAVGTSIPATPDGAHYDFGPEAQLFANLAAVGVQETEGPDAGTLHDEVPAWSVSVTLGDPFEWTQPAPLPG